MAGSEAQQELSSAIAECLEFEIERSANCMKVCRQNGVFVHLYQGAKPGCIYPKDLEHEERSRA